jgi:isochorismate synthase
LEDFFNSIETQYKAQLPFVVYRKPRESQVKAQLQQTDDLSFVKDFTETGFVFAPFDDSEDSVIFPLDKAKVIAVNYDVPQVESKILSSGSLSSEAQEFHVNLVNKGIKAINTGAFKKVVLSRQESVKLNGSNPISIFKNLLNNYNLAFVYCWYHPKVGLWLGATPETLMKIDGNSFSIMALAGTKEYQGTLDVDWGEKEQLEQKIVTDFIVENLNPLVDSFNISEIETVKAGNLLHLKTMISARLKTSSTIKQLIYALHPTPAVCGYPKLLAKEFILLNENYNRAYYTGFLGELNVKTAIAPRTSKRNIENRAYTISKKSTQLYVNLRCMQLKDSNAIIYIGGGITTNSNPESEWEETVSKSIVIKKVL